MPFKYLLKIGETQIEKNSLDRDVKGLSSFLSFFEGHKHNKKGYNHLIGEYQLNKRYLLHKMKL